MIYNHTKVGVVGGKSSPIKLTKSGNKLGSQDPGQCYDSYKSCKTVFLCCKLYKYVIS